MGKTYRRQPSFEEDKQGHRKGKHSGHSNNKKSGGMKIINHVDIDDEDDDNFSDKIQIKDFIRINKNGEPT